eukprot:403369039
MSTYDPINLLRLYATFEIEIITVLIIKYPSNVTVPQTILATNPNSLRQTKKVKEAISGKQMASE